MKKHLYLLASLIAFGAISPAVCFAEDAKKEITASYTKAYAALNKKDAAPLIAMHTPDAININEKGVKHNVKDQAPQIQQFVSMAKSISAKTTIKSVKSKGDSATASVTVSMTMVLAGPDGKSHTMVVSEADEDQWVKTPQGWRIKQSKTLTSKGTLDGKAVKQPGG